jgi:hypothetical protein
MLALYLTSYGCTGTLPRALDSLAMGQQKKMLELQGTPTRDFAELADGRRTLFAHLRAEPPNV